MKVYLIENYKQLEHTFIVLLDVSLGFESEWKNEAENFHDFTAFHLHKLHNKA